MFFGSLSKKLNKAAGAIGAQAIGTVLSVFGAVNSVPSATVREDHRDIRPMLLFIQPFFLNKGTISLKLKIREIYWV